MYYICVWRWCNKIHWKLLNNRGAGRQRRFIWLKYQICMCEIPLWTPLEQSIYLKKSRKGYVAAWSSCLSFPLGVHYCFMINSAFIKSSFCFNKKWRTGRYNSSCPGELYIHGRGEAKGRGRRRVDIVDMVDVLCISAWKWNSGTCWNCSKKEGRVEGECGGVNLI
jgi:hypothetical protein